MWEIAELTLPLLFDLVGPFVFWPVRREQSPLAESLVIPIQ